ncbi:MAG: hypothetical protein M3395_11085 [Chloroflexota bacterium]|nr:hypothetical protein [Chloroflexota bacterium]
MWVRIPPPRPGDPLAELIVTLNVVPCPHTPAGAVEAACNVIFVESATATPMHE